MTGRLVRAEFTKLVSTKVWIGLLLGACVLAGGFAALFTGFAGQQGSPAVGDPLFERQVLSVASNGTVFTIILGIIGMTQEYRHRTATPTFLTTPRRGQVVIAKLVAYALVAVPFAAVVCGVTALVAVLYSRGRGAQLSLSGDNLEVLLGAGAAMVLFAVIGVGLGSLLRNQVGAIVGALVYLFVIENLIGGIPAISSAYKWLPGGASTAMTAAGFEQGPDLLTAGQGGALLLAYGVVFAVLGTLFAVRRDVV